MKKTSLERSNAWYKRKLKTTGPSAKRKYYDYVLTGQQYYRRLLKKDEKKEAWNTAIKYFKT